jgi:hypothetical protein
MATDIFAKSLPKAKYYNCMLHLGLFSLTQTTKHDNPLVPIQVLVTSMEAKTLLSNIDCHLDHSKCYNPYCHICQSCALALRPCMGF